MTHQKDEQICNALHLIRPPSCWYKYTKKKKTSAPATATARIGTKGSWFVGKKNGYSWLDLMGGHQKMLQLGRQVSTVSIFFVYSIYFYVSTKCC